MASSLSSARLKHSDGNDRSSSQPLRRFASPLGSMGVILRQAEAERKRILFELPLLLAPRPVWHPRALRGILHYRSEPPRTPDELSSLRHLLEPDPAVQPLLRPLLHERLLWRQRVGRAYDRGVPSDHR